MTAEQPEHRDLSRGRVSGFAATIVAGVIGGLLAVVLSIAAASLVVAGHLSSYAPLLIGTALLAAIVLNLAAAASSSIKPTVAGVQEIPCVALGAVVGATAAGLSTNDGDLSFTIMAALSLATLVTGLSMVLLGAFRQGELVRFIPYPVIGGFLTGTGWLMLLGGLSIVLGEPADLSLFVSVPGPQALLRLGLTGAFVLVLLWAGRRYPAPATAPLVVLATIALFNLFVLASGYVRQDLHDNGWLVSLPAAGHIWHGWEVGGFATVDWNAVWAGVLEVPIVFVLTTIGLLLNATSIELERRQDVDLNRELKCIGGGNALAGLVGGLPGYQAVSLSLLASRLGANGRMVGVVAAAVILAVLLIGVDFLDIFPTLVVGGLLIWMGGSLMIEWLFLRWRQGGAWDLAIVVLIFATIVAVGFMQGIVVGLIAAVLLFVYQYARVDLVRDEMSADEYRGALVGSTLPRDWLDQYGKSILIIRLQGFLFFGTANRLRHHIETRMRRIGGEGRGFLVIDFQRVTGIDSSATTSFSRLQQIAAQSGVRIVVTGLRKAAQRGLLEYDRGGGEASVMHFEDDLEHGVKWCESALLSGFVDDRPVVENRPIADMLLDLVGDAAAAEAIGRYCQRVDVTDGVRLIEQGDLSNALYFIESGQATIETTHDRSASPVGLMNVGAGDIVGEMSFYLGERRSASVVAKGDLVAWRLSGEAMDRLETEAPAAALCLHRSMATLVSARLAHANRHISRLAD